MLICQMQCWVLPELVAEWHRDASAYGSPVGLISSSNNLEAIQGIADTYQRLSFELIGDTGAAHDIGSEEALTSQGLSPEVISSWKRTLENPLKFATACGVQEAREVLSGWAGNIGELLHLLKSCPLAMSIGKQIKKGRTFIWEFKKTPYIGLNHKKCRVWCPLENRWFASRVKNDVPVFNVDLPGSGTEPALPIVDSQDDVADAAEPDGTLLGAFVGSQESAPTSNDNLSQNATAGVSKGDSFTLQPDEEADMQHLPCNAHFGHNHELDGSAEQDSSKHGRPKQQNLPDAWLFDQNQMTLIRIHNKARRACLLRTG